MTTNVWEKFDEMIDTKALKEEVEKAAEQGDFPEVPHGTYEVEIEKLELTESKSGKPMMTCWMKIIDGQYKGQRLFYNQVLHVGFGIHKANEFLRSLESGLEVKFENFKQYNDLLMDIHEAIDEKLEYAVEYDQDKKGFNTFKIVEVFEVE